MIRRDVRRQFVQMAQADQFAAEEHKMKTRFDGKYRPVCSCGWVGRPFADRQEAVAEGLTHRK